MGDPDTRAIPVAKQDGQTIGREYRTNDTGAPGNGPVGLCWRDHRATRLYYPGTMHLREPGGFRWQFRCIAKYLAVADNR
jgi:hypothetical protein